MANETWTTGRGDGSGIYIHTERGPVKIGDFGEGGDAPGGSEAAARRATLAAAAPDHHAAALALLAAVDADAFPGEGDLRHGAFWMAVRALRGAVAKAEGRP